MATGRAAILRPGPQAPAWPQRQSLPGPLWARVALAGWTLPPWDPRQGQLHPGGLRPGPLAQDSAAPPPACSSSPVPPGLKEKNGFLIKYSCEAKPKIGWRGRTVTFVRHKGGDRTPRGWPLRPVPLPRPHPTTGPESPTGQTAWAGAPNCHPGPPTQQGPLLGLTSCDHHPETLFQSQGPPFPFRATCDHPGRQGRESRSDPAGTNAILRAGPRGGSDHRPQGSPPSHLPPGSSPDEPWE